MSERQQIRKPTADKTDEVIEDLPGESETATELTSKIDDLLDEIDGILEENAEAFVKAYVQKGGE